MKRLVLMIISAFICGATVFFSSCNKEEDSNSALSIYAFGQSSTKSATSNESENEYRNMFLWCTGNDIKWYNATTGELKLKNIPNSPFPTLFQLTIFLDDTELFSLSTIDYNSSKGISSPCINWERDGEWIYKGCKCGNKQDHFSGANCEPIWEYTGKGGHYYIIKDYPILSQEQREQAVNIMGQDWLDELDKEIEAFEIGWDKFIAQLKTEGKYRK